MARPTKFILRYEDYALLYKCSLRTVKRWAAAGAPLDDEVAMATWRKTKRPAPPREVEPEQPVSAPKPAPVVEQASEIEQSSSPIALESNLRNLRNRVATVEARYADALSNGAERDIRFWRQETVEVLDQLRRLEVAWSELAVSQKELIQISVVERVISPLVRLINEMFSTFSQRIAPELIGLDNQQDVEQRINWAMTDIFESMHANESLIVEWVRSYGERGGMKEEQNENII